MNQGLESLKQANVPSIRVAVLDTGCDINHEYFYGPGSDHIERLDGHWLDCVEESDEAVDEDPGRHGTAMLTLLLRLLPPDAEIFIVRVAKNGEDLGVAQDRIARASRPQH